MTVARSRWSGIGKSLFCIVLCTLLVALCRSTEAQQPTKIPKIGFLSPGVPDTTTSLKGFLQQFRNLGYVEGENVAIESRFANDKLDRLPALADELVRLKVDVLITGGLNDALAAKNATKTIPIVFLGAVSDPVGSGLVNSLAQPGGNITGFTTIAEVLAGKRLELLKETMPKLTRVAVLWDSQGRATNSQWTESQLAARQLGLQLHSMEVTSPDKYEGAFKEATKARSAALAVTQHALANSYQKQIVALATKNQLPAIYYRRDFVETGGLMSYGADRDESFKRAAVMVDKILKGAKPADLPVEQPTKFELVINLKTAKQIGVTIPQSVLYRADKVIK
jgi:putative tryptophan/tyrosine transport system substrate-binding protein